MQLQFSFFQFFGYAVTVSVEGYSSCSPEPLSEALPCNPRLALQKKGLLCARWCFQHTRQPAVCEGGLGSFVDSRLTLQSRLQRSRQVFFFHVEVDSNLVVDLRAAPRNVSTAVVGTFNAADNLGHPANQWICTHQLRGTLGRTRTKKLPHSTLHRLIGMSVQLG